MAMTYDEAIEALKDPKYNTTPDGLKQFVADRTLAWNFQIRELRLN